MERKLCIFFCSSLLPEVAQLIGNGDYPDVSLRGFPANCSGPVSFKKVIDKALDEVDAWSKIIIISSACSGGHHDLLSHRKIEIIRLEHCFEVLTTLPTIYHLISKGNYLVTNGWLKNYKQHIREWGFDEDSARTFFGESVKQIMLIETGLPGNYLPALQAVAHYMGLPYDTLPVGNSHLKMFIDAMIYKWRADSERISLNDRIARITRESADYSVLFSQLKRLIDLTEEDRIEKEIAALIDILFMPQEIIYKSLNHRKYAKTVWYKKAGDSTLPGKENTFHIDIKHRGVMFGTYLVAGIQFPQFLLQYMSMGQVISQIGGLAIENARRFTELEMARQLISASEAELRELIVTKDKFFSIIAHDLKSPFSSVIGLADMLSDQVGRDELKNVKKYTAILKESSKQAYNLLVNLLDWALSQTGQMSFHPEQIDVAVFIREFVLLFNEHASQKNIELKWETPAGIYILADRRMISTVLRNLVSNAIKFTPGGGKIVVSVGDGQNEKIIRVSDNGVGIPPERIDSLFRIDQSDSTPGTSNEKGTGLGLILCKEFVEKHGGRIWVESEENKGSVFSFSLPLP